MSDAGGRSGDEAILYAIPGSHPARTGQPMLELEGMPFRRVNLVREHLRRRPAAELMERVLPERA